MARKGQFKKGGGRHGSASKARKSSGSSARITETIVVSAPRAPARRRSGSASRRKTTTRRRGRRSARGSGMTNLLHLAVAAGVLSYATTPGKGPAIVSNLAAKIPGAATFGIPATIGIMALAADRFVKPNKWLKLLGASGIVLAASKIGSSGTDFKWVGDAGDDYAGDIGDDDDVGDADDVGDYDDVGDDDEG